MAVNLSVLARRLLVGRRRRRELARLGLDESWRWRASSTVRRSVDAAAAFLPDRVVRRIFHAATRGWGIAICAHRVLPEGAARPADATMFLDERAIDRFLSLVEPVQAGRGAACVVFTFDDGYRDAWQYVRTRAPLRPNVEFIYFVCPEKVRARAGFRWDVPRVLEDAPGIFLPLGDTGIDQLDISVENARVDLRVAGRSHRSTLATYEQCLELAAIPNVRLGDHTNSHFALSWLPRGAAREELARSRAAMRELFGPTRDFAFPYGARGLHFSDEHVAMLRELDAPVTWSIDERPFHPDERRRGAVVPRFAWEGSRSAEGLVLWMSFKSARHRATRAVLRRRAAAQDVTRRIAGALASTVAWTRGASRRGRHDDAPAR